jgi:hypothetical protein
MFTNALACKGWPVWGCGLAICSVVGQPPIDGGQHFWQSVWMRQDVPAARAEHGREIVAGDPIDRERMGRDVEALGLSQRMPDVRDSVATFIAIIVGGLSVAEEKEQALVRGLRC